MWCNVEITNSVYRLAWQIEPLMAKTDKTAMIWVGGAAVGIIVLSAVAYFVHMAIVEHGKNSHSGLFNGLCKVHDLSRPDKKLLKRIAGANRLTKPSVLFVEPKWILTAQKTPAFSSHLEQLQYLQKNLFGSPKSSGKSAGKKKGSTAKKVNRPKS